MHLLHGVGAGAKMPALWLLFTPFQQQVKIHAKFASQMDFYLQPVRFLTDLAVNAKSCLNSNALWYFVCINCCNSRQIIINEYEIWRGCEL